jgi:GT2 family glycosyltransferase
MFEMKENYIHCIIPSFNRIKQLKETYDQLISQTYKNIKIIIINDGSSDGTLEYFNSIDNENLHIINGDGNLWWGKSVNEGLKYVLETSSNEDYVLLLNDDIYFDNNLLYNFSNDLSKCKTPTILGAYQADNHTKSATHLGYKVDFLKTKITPLFSSNDDINIGALPARGLFFTIDTLKNVGLINTFLFRQAVGDLEFTARALEKGINLKICEDAIIYTDAKSDDDSQMAQSLFKRFTSRYNNNSFLLYIIFFSIRGPWFLRISSLIRFIFFRISR